MTTQLLASRHRSVATAVVSALVIVGCLGTAAEARGSRSYYRASRSGTHAHYSCEYGCSRRGRGARVLGYRSRGFGDEHFGALGRRFRRGPDGVLYAVDVGAAAEVSVEPAIKVVAPLRPTCVYDRVPHPPPGYTSFSRPLRPFEVTGQPVTFSEDVLASRGSFTLCE